MRKEQFEAFTSLLAADKCKLRNCEMRESWRRVSGGNLLDTGLMFLDDGSRGAFQIKFLAA